MPANNLEIFKKVIFHLPPFKKTFAMLILSAAIYTGLLFGFWEAYLEISLIWELIPVIGLFIFLLPAVLASEAFTYFLPDYPRRWGYFLSTVNQLIFFLFAVIMTFTDNFLTAWQILWLGITTVYLNGFIILMLSVGPDHLRKISVLTLVHPLTVLAAFHFFFGRYVQIGTAEYLSNFLVVIVAGLILLAAIHLTEFLVGSNVENASMFEMAAALLQNQQQCLELGKPARPDIQTLSVENGSGLLNVSVPWIHPGPLQGFGGGKIATKIIGKLNRDGEGFMFHVPSSHLHDPADPEDYRKVLDAMEQPERTDEASQLIKKDYDICTMYGRKFGDRKIIYFDQCKFDGQEFDDYDAEIFTEVIDTDRVAVIDLHNHSRDIHGEVMKLGSSSADRLREALEDFLQLLDEQETSSYTAGYKVNLEADRPVFSLVEEVDGQKTLVFGIEGNGATETLIDLDQRFSKEFDEALLFTTDTHASIHDFARGQRVTEDDVVGAVTEAEKNVSEASIGLSCRRAEEMNFLYEDYFGLIYSINILVRLIPISLLALYAFLVIWLL